MNKPSLQRAFIVGCPRSGTTLLQGMLTAHPLVCSFPETHFFCAVFPLSPIRKILMTPERGGRRCLTKMLHSMRRPDLIPLARQPYTLSSYAGGFLRVLDQLAIEQNAQCWIEKTPDHFRRIPRIQAAIPEAKFIHVIRDGRDTVRSLHIASNKAPFAWYTRWRWIGKGLTWNACIARWNAAIQTTWRYRDDPQHAVVAYETLIAQPERTARACCAFLQIPFDEAMLHPEQAYDRIVTKKVAWKENNARPIQKITQPVPPLPEPIQKRLDEALDMERYRALRPLALGVDTRA